MRIYSSAFEDKGSMPSLYTCDGDNVNPPLSFGDVPEEAKSLVLVMDDPDVPKYIREDGMWDHWLVWNIPADEEGIPEAVSHAPGVVGKNTSGTYDYVGPCPPDREHRYFFKLYALDSTLDLPKDASKQDIENAMEGHVLAKAELMGRYERV